MERTAYGVLELTPEQFFELTPRQFSLMYEGFRDREMRKARYIQYLVSPHVKKVPRIEEIAGLGGGERNVISLEEKRAKLDALYEQFGITKEGR